MTNQQQAHRQASTAVEELIKEQAAWVCASRRLSWKKTRVIRRASDAKEGAALT